MILEKISTQTLLILINFKIIITFMTESTSLKELDQSPAKTFQEKVTFGKSLTDDFRQKAGVGQLSNDALPQQSAHNH